MCRNIKTLFNFEPPATELEIRDASLQFVRKLSGFTVPSKANEAAFEAAVQKVADAARELIGSMVTQAPARNRDTEAAKARERSIARFGARYVSGRATRFGLSWPRASLEEGICMLFMVIERFRDNDMVPIYERVRDKGRSLPDGLKYVDSWVEPNFSRCFQLMECDDARLLQEWVLRLRGSGVSFEFIPVVSSAQTREVVAPHLKERVMRRVAAAPLRGLAVCREGALVLGHKRLAWGSIDVPMVPPRPVLQQLLGGFRRIPVLQYGADFFCDTRLLPDMLDSVHPERPLMPAHAQGVVHADRAMGRAAGVPGDGAGALSRAATICKPCSAPASILVTFCATARRSWRPRSTRNDRAPCATARATTCCRTWVCCRACSASAPFCVAMNPAPPTSRPTTRSGGCAPSRGVKRCCRTSRRWALGPTAWLSSGMATRNLALPTMPCRPCAPRRAPLLGRHHGPWSTTHGCVAR